MEHIAMRLLDDERTPRTLLEEWAEEVTYVETAQMRRTRNHLAKELLDALDRVESLEIQVKALGLALTARYQ
jgi:hypothetical protein